MTKGRIVEVTPRSKGCAVVLDIKGNKFEADFSYEPTEPLDSSCQALAGILAANFALSYLPLDDMEFACSDEEEFRLMSTLAYQNRMSYAYLVRDNRRVSDHLINTEPHYTWKRVKLDKVEAIQNPDRVLCFYSGGKDSTVSLKVLEAAGYSVLPFFVFLSKDVYCHTADDALRLFLEGKRDFAMANTNIDELKPFFSKVTGLPSLEGTLRLYWVANALPLATAMNASLISLSNELTLTNVVEYAGRRVFNNLFDQTFPAAVLVNQLLKRKGLPTIFSLVQGLTVYAIEKLLSARFPEKLAHQLSCNQPIYDDLTEQWRCCSWCKKYHSLYLNVRAVGLPPDTVRLDEGTILSTRFNPEELIGPDISRKELEHCLAIDNNYAPDYKGIVHPEVSGIQFSAAYHNPCLCLSSSEYDRLYKPLSELLQGGIYLSDNGSTRESSLQEVWNALRSYDYVFDGKEAKVVGKDRYQV